MTLAPPLGTGIGCPIRQRMRIALALEAPWGGLNWTPLSRTGALISANSVCTKPERVPLKIDILEVVLGSKHGPAEQHFIWYLGTVFLQIRLQRLRPIQLQTYSFIIKCLCLDKVIWIAQDGGQCAGKSYRSISVRSKHFSYSINWFDANKGQ